MRTFASIVIAIIACITSAAASPAGVSQCEAGCANDAVSCYEQAGSTLSSSSASDIPSAIIQCNEDLENCSTECAEGGF